MATEKVKAIAIGTFDGMTVRKNKSIDLTFIFPFDQRAEALKTTLFVSQDIRVLAKVGKEKPIELGYFRFNNFNFNSHGESKVKLSAFLEYVNMENVNSIADNEVLLTIMFVSEIEVEDEEE